MQQQGELSQLAAQLSQVDTQLSTLSAVRSPYAGKIARLKFQDQTDQSLAVELVLVISDDRSHPGTAQALPNPIVSSSQTADP